MLPWASVVCVGVLASLARALPAGVVSTTVGSFNGIDAALDIEFLPSGFQLVAGRTGIILVTNIYDPALPQQTYLDLTSVTMSDGVYGGVSVSCV